jgi:hypothetical protein
MEVTQRLQLVQDESTARTSSHHDGTTIGRTGDQEIYSIVHHEGGFGKAVG